MILYSIFFFGIAIIVGIWAHLKFTTTYNHFAQVASRGGITGRDAAHFVMQNAGIHDVEIVPIPGRMIDHYDPIKKRLALSEENYAGTSLAALGVAAHEAGHAIQHAVGYQALQLRTSLVPITNIASKYLHYIILGGFAFQILGLIKLGILCYVVLTVFQLVTLPVEFDASRRAKLELSGLNIIAADEMPGVVRKRSMRQVGPMSLHSSLRWANLIYLLLCGPRPGLSTRIRWQIRTGRG